ncbi:MAG: hypothetical protein J0L82_19580 [Deltaproteobacteria bacterium]|jgi:hypothetical protein|nr:hypothetical protein [Deltaproteobacteria bacterium]
MAVRSGFIFIVCAAIVLAVFNFSRTGQIGNKDQNGAIGEISNLNSNTNAGVDVQVQSTPMISPEKPPIKEPGVQNALSATPKPNPNATPVPSVFNIIEIFEGLPTTKWYYRTQDPKLVDGAENESFKRYGRHFDGRLTPLIDLKEPLWFAMGINENFKLLVEKFKYSDLNEVAFRNGELISEFKISEISSDAPVCLVYFSRGTAEKLAYEYPNVYFENAVLTERGNDIRGVRVNVNFSHNTSFEGFIRAFECLIRISNPNDKISKKILLLHLVATLGIDGSLQRKPSSE